MGSVARPVRRFFSELRRRHVLRVVVAYAAGAWLVLQIGEVTFGPLGVPDAALAVMVLVALIGFPIITVLAWFFPVGRIADGATEPDGATGAVARGARRAPRTVGSAGATTETDARDRGAVVLDNVPAPPTPLVDREGPMGDARRLLAEGCRILTVTGTAGVGKTRLLLELGQQLGPEYPNGVCFAPASPLHAPEGLPFLLAERLGLGFARGEDPWSATLAFLREKRLLLLVDNFEQISSGASMLSELSARSPGVVLVVSSRERLGLSGETALGLEGLPYPGAGAPAGEPPDDDPGSCPAIGLFIQSARRVDRTFEVTTANRPDVIRICRLVEGIPLALELAAGGVGVLSPGEIARELEHRYDLPLGSPRDAPLRHRSLRAAFESSWVLLDPEEQRVLRQLSVFRGGFSRPAAKAVAGAELPILAALLDKSLLRRPAEGRLEMLEIVRQFAAEKLDADPAEREAARDRHAGHYSGLLEEMVRRSDSGEAGAALAEVAADADNVRTAWSWLIDRLDYDGLDRAIDGVFRFWEARGWVGEGRELFRRAVRAVDPPMGAARPHPPRRRLLARLLAREGIFAEMGDDHGDAKDLLEHAHSLFIADEDARELAIVLCSLSFTARAGGEFDRAHTLAGESLALYRAIGDAAGTATALNSLGAQCFTLGRYDEAKAHYREAVEIFRELGDTNGLWKPLNNLAGIALVERDYGEARRLLEETLAHQRSRGSRRGEANALQNLGLVAYRTGNHDEAERALMDTIAITEDAGYRGLLAHAQNTLGAVRLARNDPPGALSAYREALTTACEVRDLPLALTILLGVARVQAHRGEDRDAVASILRVVRSHPACDDETRADAAALLTELGEDVDAVGDRDQAPDQAPDLDGLRELGMRMLTSVRGSSRTSP